MLQYPAVNSPSVQSEEQLTKADVLVVDDNLELLSVLSEILSLNGYSVQSATNGHLALELLSSHSPDLIICDIMMPMMDGFELHSVIRDTAEWCDIPFVFLTALSDPREIRLGRESGCDDYLTKPFDPSDLISVVKGKLTLARHRRLVNEARMESYRRRVVHTLSHEFRTPLVSINTGTELLIDQHKNLKHEHVERLLESISRGGQRLERLVNDFMLLQQIDLGEAERLCKRYKRKTSLLEAAEIAVESYKELFPETADIIELVSMGCTDKNSMVDVYDVQLVSIIQRLLSNSQKFAGTEKTITVTVSTEGALGIIRIRDMGPGLKRQNTACDPLQAFTQVDRDIHEQQGCGLGLTIANHFALINGGKLRLFEPEDGVGLLVEVSLPLAG